MSISDTSGSTSSHDNAPRANVSDADDSMTSCLGSPFKQFPAVRGKENQFMDKNGRRHHGYETDKAPYPLSYCPEVLEMEALDLVYTQTVKQSVTFVDFPHGPPQRSLSLGCGYGHWVIEAAKEWPNCEFIGFDLMNIQIPLAVLDDSTTRRIKWVHGNFLTNRLPFDDDEFDHIHIARLAKGIPESKWSSLFEEVLRVLRPGGAVELLEEDIIFPTLPHWFTEPLRVRAGKSQAVHLPDVSEAPPVLAVPDPYHQLPHDHALLESLYYAVFENRFINLKPTAILASSFNAYFSGVWSAPALKFPMPPIRPPPPPPDLTLMQSSKPLYVTEDPIIRTEDQRPRSISVPTSHSGKTTGTATSVNSSMFSTSWESASSAATSAEPCSDVNPPYSSSSHPANGIDDSEFLLPSPSPPLPSVDFAAPEETTELGSNSGNKLLDEEDLHRMNNMSDHVLGMHLYKVVQDVLACQEAMWEELKSRILNRKGTLKAFGWDDDEELEELQSRRKFEILIERYQSDMRVRISLWSSLTDMGWTFPIREQLSKAEHLEEERVRRDLLEAIRRHGRDSVSDRPCRNMKAFFGYKPA